MAASFGLPTASRKDSQDLCFLAGDDYRNFLQRNAAEMLTPGEIVRRDGRAAGRHSGLANYTIGQRKGLAISSPVPLYVLGKDPAKNALIVGTEDELGKSEMNVEGINWMSGAAPAGPVRAEVKIRYTARPAWAEVMPGQRGTEARVHFEAPIRDISPGQAAVFYSGDEVLGGGRIV
jgi:tRNA-specific 2-thiouridylase